MRGEQMFSHRAGSKYFRFVGILEQALQHGSSQLRSQSGRECIKTLISKQKWLGCRLSITAPWSRSLMKKDVTKVFTSLSRAYRTRESFVNHKHFSWGWGCGADANMRIWV